MTLINQMLKDLEQQKKRNLDNATQGLNPVGDLSQPRRSRMPQVLGVLSMGALLAGVFWMAKDMHVVEMGTVAQAVATPIPAPVAAPKAAPATDIAPVAEVVPLADVVAEPMITAEQPSIEPVMPLVAPKTPPLVMEAIDWKINKQAMAVRFRLPSKINYEVVVDDKKNIVTLTFPHTVFGGDKPLILLENEFADKVEKIQDGDFLQVKAYLKPNIAISSVDYSLDTKKPTLVMSLSRN